MRQGAPALAAACRARPARAPLSAPTRAHSSTHPLSPAAARPQVIGNKYESYTKMLMDDVGPGEAMDRLGLKRYCCRRMVLTHVDLIDKLLAYHTFQTKAEFAKK